MKSVKTEELLSAADFIKELDRRYSWGVPIRADQALAVLDAIEAGEED